jgi:hypothetical protein
MNIWSITEEKRVMIIQISFSNERNEGLSVPRKTNLCTESAEWFSLKNPFYLFSPLHPWAISKLVQNGQF